MRRQMAVVHAILRWFSGHAEPWAPFPELADSPAQDVVQYHVDLCMQAGFVQKQPHTSGQAPRWQLTWAGHEMLDTLNAQRST